MRLGGVSKQARDSCRDAGCRFLLSLRRKNVYANGRYLIASRRPAIRLPRHFSPRVKFTAKYIHHSVARCPVFCVSTACNRASRRLKAFPQSFARREADGEIYSDVHTSALRT